MTSRDSSAEAPGSARASRAGLLLPVAGAGLLLACVVTLVRGRQETHTVSHVERTIRDVALAGHRGETPDAGFIGPWKVTASHVDPLSGDLVDFHLTSGAMIVGAARAGVLVDPVQNTFSFDLRDVVFVRLPDEDAGDSGVHALEQHLLGPAPYGLDIVEDHRGAP